MSVGIDGTRRRRKGQQAQGQGRALPKVQVVSCCDLYLFLFASHRGLVGRTQKLIQGWATRSFTRFCYLPTGRLDAMLLTRVVHVSADDGTRRVHREACRLPLRWRHLALPRRSGSGPHQPRCCWWVRAIRPSPSPPSSPSGDADALEKGMYVR
jgi:hypothetical protein